MNAMTIGVALITYNGMKYLPQQLESIVAQTRRIDHLVISDDRSTDGTWEFLESWAMDAPMRVTLIRNELQLGLNRNFEQSIRALDTMVIFTCDQDDVWIPEKVALVTDVFAQHPDVLLVHTDATLVDAEGHDLGKTLLGELELTNRERAAMQSQQPFSVYCRRNLVTGATAAIRRTLLATALPLSIHHYHDAWLALIAAGIGKVYFLDRPTIFYRQHGSNLVGVKKLGMTMKLRKLSWEIRGPNPLSQRVNTDLAWRSALYERLSREPNTSRAVHDYADAARSFYQARAAYPRNPFRRILAVLRKAGTGGYGRFSYTPRSDVLRDILNK